MQSHKPGEGPPPTPTGESEETRVKGPVRRLLCTEAERLGRGLSGDRAGGQAGLPGETGLGGFPEAERGGGVGGAGQLCERPPRS